jgi:hypothetical protein
MFLFIDSKITIILVFYLLGLLRITSAAITPGTHPQSHNKKTITIDPQPLSKTAKGGQIIDSKTLQKLILIYNLQI